MASRTNADRIATAPSQTVEEAGEAVAPSRVPSLEAFPLGTTLETLAPGMLERGLTPDMLEHVAGRMREIQAEQGAFPMLAR
jgi:hypothetical protein